MNPDPDTCAGCESAPATATHASGDRLCAPCHARAQSYDYAEAAAEIARACLESADSYGLDWRDPAVRRALALRVEGILSAQLGARR